MGRIQGQSLGVAAICAACALLRRTTRRWSACAAWRMSSMRASSCTCTRREVEVQDSLGRTAPAAAAARRLGCCARLHRRAHESPRRRRSRDAWRAPASRSSPARNPTCASRSGQCPLATADRARRAGRLGTDGAGKRRRTRHPGRGARRRAALGPSQYSAAEALQAGDARRRRGARPPAHRRLARAGKAADLICIDLDTLACQPRRPRSPTASCSAPRASR